MFIDKTHSKKDLVDLFKTLNIFLDKNLSKGEIIKIINEKVDECKFNNNIKNKTELFDYLKNKTEKQRPNIDEKKRVMLLSKKIVKYCTNDCMLNEATFENHQDAYNSLLSICQWGDIPSVRRACRLYNKCGNCINHINPKISKSVEKEIINKRLIKKTYLTSLKIKYATKENPIILKFD